MRTDALDIARFYRTPQGRAARDMMLRRIKAVWPSVTGQDVLGFGYAVPVLDALKGDARRTVAFMPGAQGAVPWPNGADARSLTALGDEHRLPFSEAMFDRVVLVHALEEAVDPRRLLREMWRILAPEGRMLVVAAHRGGVWSRMDSLPFGHGRPYSRAQLSRLLTEALFEPVAWSKALYAPPWRFACGEKTAEGFETLGERVAPVLGGLILVEAVKHVGAVRPEGLAERVRRKALEGARAPALSPRTDKSTVSEKQEGTS